MMKRFEKYLIKKGRTTSTIDGYINLMNFFLEWCRVFGVNHKKASLEELYDYQSYNREIGNSPRTMEAKISVLREYYRFTKRKHNPALLVQTERPEKKLPKNLLDEEALMNMYLDYQPKKAVYERNKIMLGLFIFQGLTRTEIEALEVEHVDFEKKRIYIPKTVLTNRRYITLHPIQKRDLEQYISNVRVTLLEQAKYTTSRLFFSTRAKNGLTDVHTEMLRRLQPQLPDLVSFQQLRFSRISLWVNELGLRKAQYLSGMKNVTSLIRYKKTDKEKLKQKLSIVHPMERLKLAG